MYIDHCQILKFRCYVCVCVGVCVLVDESEDECVCESIFRVALCSTEISSQSCTVATLAGEGLTKHMKAPWSFLASETNMIN